jgi:hypothetical protein
MRRKLRKPSPSIVIACIALFVALGPSAYAVANTVFSTDIVDGEVKTPDLANLAVNNAKLGPNAVATGKVVDGSLGTADLADGAVGTSKIADGAVTGAKIANAPSGSDDVNADLLDGVDSSALMRAPTRWKRINTVGERYPIEIGNPACSGNRLCTATIRCDPGDVLLSGGFDSVDSGTRLFAAFPFNANGFDQKYIVSWANNSTADTVSLVILCANQ